MATTKTGSKTRTGFAHEFDDKIKQSQTTLATGGGEPIEKGHKRTTEKRVLQPRDPETGKFDYNSSAGIERKYDYHADRNGSAKKGWKNEKQVPWSFKDAVQMFAKKAELKAGDVLVTENDRRYIASMDMTQEEFVESVETISGLNKLSQGMVTKKGRMTKEEAAKKAERDAAREKYKKELDDYNEMKAAGFDVDKPEQTWDKSWESKSGGKYGKSTKKELKSALKDYLNGKSSNAFPTDFAAAAADLDPQTLANNQAFNAWYDSMGHQVVSDVMKTHSDNYVVNKDDILGGLNKFFADASNENKISKSAPSDKAKENIAKAILFKIQNKKSSK